MTKEKLNSIFFDELKLRINPEDFLTFSSDVDIEWWLEVYNEKIQNSRIKKRGKICQIKSIPTSAKLY